MSNVIPLVQGDNLVPVYFQITTAQGSSIDLTNTSSIFKMRSPGSGVDLINAGTSMISAQGGIVSYTFTSSDTATANLSYQAEITIQYTSGNASGRIVKVEGLVVQVSGALP